MRLTDGIYRISAFPQDILVAFSSRQYDARKDLFLFLDSLGVTPRRFSTVKQVHEAKVVTASPSVDSSGEVEADAMVTQERGLPLIIRTADCAPLFFFDPEHRAVGICHVGWRGAKKGIVGRVMERLASEFGSRPESLQVGVGPAICHSCYEVRSEFQGYFPGNVRERSGRYFFDLVREVKDELNRSGVPREKVWESGFCTACATGQFFSARREGEETGRFLSAVMLK